MRPKGVADAQTVEIPSPPKDLSAGTLLEGRSQVLEKGERAARGTVQQAGKQGEKVIHAVRERGRAKNEAEAFREKNGESSASSFSSGTEKTYQPKEQMKNRTGAQTGRTAGEQVGKKGAQIRELPKQTVKTIDRGEKTICSSM